MAITKPAKQAVDQLNDQNFFLTINDPSTSGTQKNALRTEKLQEFADNLLKGFGGQDLGGWGERIEAEIRSGAPLQNVVADLQRLRSVEGEISRSGIDVVRAAHGYSESDKSAELQGGELVQPDKITSETQVAYQAAQAAKAEKGQSPADS